MPRISPSDLEAALQNLEGLIHDDKINNKTIQELRTALAEAERRVPEVSDH